LGEFFFRYQRRAPGDPGKRAGSPEARYFFRAATQAKGDLVLRQEFHCSAVSSLWVFSSSWSAVVSTFFSSSMIFSPMSIGSSFAIRSEQMPG